MIDYIRQKQKEAAQEYVDKLAEIESQITELDAVLPLDNPAEALLQGSTLEDIRAINEQYIIAQEDITILESAVDYLEKKINQINYDFNQIISSINMTEAHIFMASKNAKINEANGKDSTMYIDAIKSNINSIISKLTSAQIPEDIISEYRDGLVRSVLPNEMSEA